VPRRCRESNLTDGGGAKLATARTPLLRFAVVDSSHSYTARCTTNPQQIVESGVWAEAELFTCPLIEDSTAVAYCIGGLVGYTVVAITNPLRQTEYVNAD